MSNTNARVGIGSFLLKTALFWGIISFVAAIVLYNVSFASLRDGLSSTNAVAAKNAALLALGFNLIEIVALVWVFVDEFVGGDVKDTFIDLFIKIVLGIILLGDCVAIFYSTGYTTNLPGNAFGDTLTIGLRAVGAIIGGTGSETFLLISGMMIWVWWLKYTGQTIQHHTPTNTPAAPTNTPAAPAKRKVTVYTMDDHGQKKDGHVWVINRGWSALSEVPNGIELVIVDSKPPSSAPAEPPPPASPHHVN